MRCTLLGTGSAFPSPNRVQCGTLLEEDGHRLLIDCGSGVLHRLASLEETTVFDIDTVLLTHHHLDHVSDVPGVVKARVLRDESAFAIMGPPGTERVCESLLAIDELGERADLDICEFEPADGTPKIGPFSADVAEGTHSKRSFSYRFGDALTICGDTGVDADVLELADGCHTMVHECSYPDVVETDTHTTPTALGEAVGDIEIERLYLTHLFPQTEAVEGEVRETVASYSDAAVSIARDLVSFEIPRN